jgi:hypothetical protein
MAQIISDVFTVDEYAA